MAKEIEVVLEFQGGARLALLPEFQEAASKVFDGLEPGQRISATYKVVSDKQVRTITQNSSLHKYFSNLSTALNNAGCDQRGIMASIGNGSPIPWSPFSVKALWKQVQLLRHGKDSTTKMTTAEYSEEHRIFDNMISEASGGVSCSLPSRESMSYEKAQ